MRYSLRSFKSFLLVFFTVFLMALLSCNKSQNDRLTKENVEIVILQGDITTDSLKLNHEGIVYVHKGKKVTWTIDSSSNVDSFWIEEKRNTEQIFIFLDRPPSKPTKKGGGRVSWFARDKKVYEYSIHWRKKQDTLWRIFDPKLAVNPSKSNIIYWIIGLILGVVVLFTSWFRFKAKRRN